MASSISECLIQLPRVIQNTYFQLNPRNPTNSEDHFQELLRHNLSLLGYRVASEISYQKVALDLNGEPLQLKNKTERFDLTIDSLKLLFELKHTTDLEESACHQLWNYMDHSDYEYGIVINFPKPNKKLKYRTQTRVFHKQSSEPFTDSYGFTYTRNTYPLMESYESQDYSEDCITKLKF
jgi:GxxExxY protein|tara:strand:+ start:2188 stop:2727 length:540 start_codon:yes stop_codon:yes gene_type:complete